MSKKKKISEALSQLSPRDVIDDAMFGYIYDEDRFDDYDDSTRDGTLSKLGTIIETSREISTIISFYGIELNKNSKLVLSKVLNELTELEMDLKGILERGKFK